MCKCIQNCLETCWWHLIEKRFCYDESIALYEVPGGKEEKNNNFFDNLAFYDSVSVIAGRAIVTIDPLPEKPKTPIVQQPLPNRKLRWLEEMEEEEMFSKENVITRSMPQIYEIKETEEEKSLDSDNKIKEEPALKMETLKPENLRLDVELRRKSLRERRMSKSLYLKLDQPKEVPIIRQQSVPKFYLDTPDESGARYSGPSTALTSPMPKQAAFQFDLYSIVQIEKSRIMFSEQNTSQTPVHRKESERSSRLAQIKEKIKLRRSKSSLGSVINLPHSQHHM